MAIDIDELNRLHAATTQGWPGNKRQWTCRMYEGMTEDSEVAPQMILKEWRLTCELYNAWPEIAAEITRLQSALSIDQVNRAAAERLSICEHG